MDSTQIAIFGLIGLAAVVALVVTALIVWHAIYIYVYSRRLLFYSFFPVDEQIPLYIALILSSIADVVGTLLSSLQTFGQVISEKVINRLPLIIGLILLSLVAIAWTEYHDVYIQRAMDVYQCFAVPLLYDARVMTLANLVRLVYNVIWPVVRFIARLTRYLIRSLPFTVLQCASTEILGGGANIANGAVKFALAVGEWTSGPGGVTNCTLDVTDAAADVTLGVERILISPVVCTCEAIDFLPEIAFGWLSDNSTAAVLNGTVVLAADAFLKIPVRTLTGINPGTVPGVTADYGFVPNLDPLFDDVCKTILSAGQVVNRIIFILVKELVGLFDDTLFAPGSPEQVILAKDWIGFVARAGCAVVEAARWAYRVIWSIVLVIVGVIVEAFGGTSPVPLLCDLREWRALYDFGGRSGIYYKTGGIGGELNLALDHLQQLIDDLADPIAGKLVVSLPRGAVDLAVGTLNLIIRFIMHGVDSEFRTFSPVQPPRTGLPATTWTPPTALPPAPLDCSTTNAVPGNYWVWLQHHFDDPDGGHLMLIDEDIGGFAEGLDDLGSLALLRLGDFLSNLVLLPFYLLDYLVQTGAAANIIFTEPPAKFALFASRWRYQRYLDSYSDLGEGLGDSVRELHPVPCVEPSDGVFCALGNVFDDTFAILDELGVQIMFTFITTRLQDIQLPDFTTMIQNLEDSLAGLFALGAITIPPLPIPTIANPTLFNLTLQETFADLYVAVPRAAIIILTVPNYAIASFQTPLDEMKMGSPAATIASALGLWFKDLFVFIFNELDARLCDKSPNALIPAIGEFLDRLAFLPVFSPIADAICVLVDAIKFLVSDFALELIGLLITVIARFLDIFFNPDAGSFRARIETFFNALINMIGFILVELPTFLIELFFGFIGALLPEPLGTIFAAVSRAIIDGLCTVLQFFISTVIDVLNFFGANLTPVDLNCGTKKRTASPDMERGREALVKTMIGAYESSAAVRTRVDRIRRFMVSMKRGMDTDNAADGVPFSVFGDSVTTANHTAFHAAHNGTSLPMSMNQAIAAISEFAEWQGNSLCDKIVLEISRSERDVNTLSLVERSHLEDCVSKRALGEIVSVLPYMHWFPREGLYDPMSWARLGFESIRAYRIVSQYNQDRSMPREVVLSDVYRQQWDGLRVDHLTRENYAHMIHNMTMEEYFARNDGNYEIVRGVYGLWNATRDSGVNLGNYLDNVSKVLGDTSGRGSLDEWLYGEDYMGGDLPPNIKHRQDLWRSMLRVTSRGATVIKRTVQVGMEQGLPSKMYTAATATPGLVSKGVAWMVSEPTEEWREAVRQRDEILAQNGIYMNVTGRSADSGIFGRFSLSAAKKGLSQWAANKMQRAVERLRPNSPRARRNWHIMGQFLTDARNALRTGFMPAPDGSRPYTPRYATGLTTINEAGGPVAELQTCNTTLVPFCLNCEALDGLFQQSVIGGMEFADYWNRIYPGYSTLFSQTQDYIENDVVNVCDGDGFSEINFPSALQLTDGATFFDVFGGNGGALNGVIDFLRTEVGSFIGSLSRDDVYATIRRLTMWPRPRVADPPPQLSIAAGDSFIVDYLDGHTEFDPTYDGVASFVDITIVARALDDFHGFLADIDLSLTPDPNPFGNGTVELPMFETNSTGFLSDFLGAFITADYGYDCDNRFMSLKQGAFLALALGFILFVILKALGDAVVPETFTTMVVTVIVATVVPLVFFVLVYGVPAQNLFFLPLPVPPPCFGNDLVDLVVCEALPKCPAIVAGVIDGPYTEQNCRTCPFEPDIANCKRDYDVRHGYDVALLILEWWVPDFMDSLREDGGGIAATALGLAGLDLTRYENLDLSDKPTFDALISCIGIMAIATLPTLALAFIAFQITTAVVTQVLAELFGKVVALLLTVFLVVSGITNLLRYNLIYVVTPGERGRLRGAVESARSRRGAGSDLGIPSSPLDVARSAVRYVDEGLGISRILSANRERSPLSQITAASRLEEAGGRHGRKGRRRRRRRGGREKDA